MGPILHATMISIYGMKHKVLYAKIQEIVRLKIHNCLTIGYLKSFIIQHG